MQIFCLQKRSLSTFKKVFFLSVNLLYKFGNEVKRQKKYKSLLFHYANTQTTSLFSHSLLFLHQYIKFTPWQWCSHHALPMMRFPTPLLKCDFAEPARSPFSCTSTAGTSTILTQWLVLLQFTTYTLISFYLPIFNCY